MYNAIQLGTLAGILCFTLAWKRIRRIKDISFSLINCVYRLSTSVFYVNVTGYYATHVANANQPRYLLPGVAILMVLLCTVLAYVLKKFNPYAKT